MDLCFTLWVRTYHRRSFFCYTNCPRFDQVALWTQRRAKIRTQVCLVPRSAVLLARDLPPCSQLSSQPALASGSPWPVPGQCPPSPHRMLGPSPVLSSRTDVWPHAVRCAQCQSVKLTPVDFLLQMGRGVRNTQYRGDSMSIIGLQRVTHTSIIWP